MEQADVMSDFLFYIFSALTVAGALGVIVNKNPVLSAFSLTATLLGLAALFILLNAYLLGILQVLVCGGALMLLFLFVIMVMKMAGEERRKFSGRSIIIGALVALVFVMQLVHVLWDYVPGAQGLEELPADGGSNIGQIGKLLIARFYFPAQMVVVLLLVATSGVLVFRKQESNTP